MWLLIVINCFSFSWAISESDVYEFIVQLGSCPTILETSPKATSLKDLSFHVDGRDITYTDVKELIPRACEKALQTTRWRGDPTGEKLNRAKAACESINAFAGQYLSKMKADRPKNMDIDGLRVAHRDVAVLLPGICQKYTGIPLEIVPTLRLSSEIATGCNYLEEQAVRFLVEFNLNAKMPTEHAAVARIAYSLVEWAIPEVCQERYSQSGVASSSSSGSPSLAIHKISTTCDYFYANVFALLKEMSWLITQPEYTLDKAVKKFKIEEPYDVSFKQAMPYIRTVCKKINDGDEDGNFDDPAEKENVVLMCNHVNRYP